MKIYTYLGIVFILVFSACTEKAVPPIHPTDWAERDSEFSHIDKIVASEGVDGCHACHGNPNDIHDYYGGSSGVSCYQCHEGGPSGHPAFDVWMDGSAEESHIQEIINNGLERCTTCHGEDYLGGFAEVSCYQCHAGGPNGHPANDEWMNFSSDNFHGVAGSERGFEDCLQCHADDYEDNCRMCHGPL